ncbi:MAG: hypothetical protein WKF63_04080 [Thermomicrobiales bacterium]
MSSFPLHEFMIEREAQLRHRAAREAAQLDLALQANRRPFAYALRRAFGRALVGLGHSIQGPQERHGSLGQSPIDHAPATI